MNKPDIKKNAITISGNIMAVSGGIVMGASAFAALISGMVVASNQPYTSHLYADKAEKIANTVATKLGYETQLISDSSLMHQHTQYLLTPYDSLYHNCTGQLPTDNSFKWKFDSNGQYYTRVPNDSYSASNYTISKNQVDPSKQNVIKDFNTQYKAEVHSATYDPGNPHTINNCTKILIIISIIFSSALMIAIIGCCLGDFSNIEDENIQKRNHDDIAKQDKIDKSKYSDEGLEPKKHNQNKKYKKHNIKNANKEVEGYQPAAYAEQNYKPK